MNYKKIFELLAILIDRACNYHSLSERDMEKYKKIAYLIKECVEHFGEMIFQNYYSNLKEYCKENNEQYFLEKFINCIEHLNCYKKKYSYFDGRLITSHIGRIIDLEYVETWHIFQGSIEKSFNDCDEYLQWLSDLLEDETNKLAYVPIVEVNDVGEQYVSHSEVRIIKK